MYKYLAWFIIMSLFFGCASINDNPRVTDKTLNKIAECTGGIGDSAKLMAGIEASVDKKKKGVTGSTEINYEKIIKGVIFSDETISEEMKKFYFVEYQKCLNKIRNSSEPTMACPDNYQSHYVSQLDFGFCYPRHSWELDRGAVDIRAADIYLRYASNRDISVHYHVSVIPSNYSEKHDDYSKAVANTWRQLDKNLETSVGYLSGRQYYKFKLHVQDRNSIVRPTEVTHVYLSPEKLLEIIVTSFDKTELNVLEQQVKIVSSTSIFK